MKKDRSHDIIAQVRASYGAIAEDFDRTRKSPWPEFKEFSRYVKEGDRVLDLGCGNGRLHEFLKGHGVSYVGVDHNEAMLRVARLNHPDAQFELADMADLKIAPEGREQMEALAASSFDMVFCVAAFHHLPGKHLRRRAAADVHSLLKKDGALILTVWNLFQWRYWRQVVGAIFASLFSLGARGAWNDLWVKWGDYPQKRYYHAFLPGELLGYFGADQWKIEKFHFTRKGHNVPFRKSFNLVLIARKK